MLSILLSIALFLGACMILVLVHELGHYAIGRYCGAKILRFSIGFGRPLWLWRDRHGTEYVIAAIPLGGYVSLLDEHLPLFKRAAVIVAGSFANLFFAVLLYWVVLGAGITHIRPIIGYIVPGSMAAQAQLQQNSELQAVNTQSVFSWMSAGIAFISHIGDKTPLTLRAKTEKTQRVHDYQLDLSQWKPDPLTPDWLSSLGIEPALPPESIVIQKINPYHSAAQAGIRVGDRILAIQDQPITDRMMFLRLLKPYAGQAVRFTFEREGRRLHAMITIGQCRSWKGIFEGYLGITLQPVQWPQTALYREQAPLFTAAYLAVKKTGEMAVFNMTVMAKLIEGKLSIQNLSGPLGMFMGSLITMQQGFIPYISFLALLSVGLGMVNLIPIPGLDGARFIYLLIERIRGRPLSNAAQLLAFRLGIIFLVVMMIQVLLSDMLRLTQNLC